MVLCRCSFILLMYRVTGSSTNMDQFMVHTLVEIPVIET